MEDAEPFRTLIHHSHNADGTLRADHCCGCFNIRLDDLVAYCNECGEERDILAWLTGKTA